MVSLWDVFISHASEDKDEVARPLAEALQNRGLQVWYDEYTLKMGDSLRKTIDRGLSESTYGIVILSKAFFAKDWPPKELDGLFARETEGKIVILPIWHDLTKEDVEHYSPLLAGRYAAKTKDGMSQIVKMIMDVVEKRVTYPETPPDIISLPQIDTAIGDIAVMRKIKEMSDWIPPTTQVIGKAATSGDYLKMGLNAALLKTYIDKNIPELKELGDKATTKRPITQEFIAMLEDLRSSSDLTMKAVDRYNSNDIEGAAKLLIKGREYSKKAIEHQNQTNDLLK